MKALTLHQPFASLVAIGAKRIETRSWRTSYRGPLAIHAAKTLPLSWMPFRVEPFLSALNFLTITEYGVPDLRLLPLGAVVATCQLWGIVDTEHVNFATSADELREAVVHVGETAYLTTDEERGFGDFTPGRYAWLLADVRKLDEPIPAVGHQRLWEWGA